MKNKQFVFPFLIIFTLFLVAAPPAHADSAGLILRGVAKTLTAVFSLPAQMIKGSTQMFPIGLITGTVSGTMKMLMGVLSGGLDIARGGAPYAKYFFLAG